MSDTVPAGWDYKQLGDYVADSAAGEWGTEAQGDDNDIPVLRSTNFTESGVIDYTKLAFRNIEEKKRTKKALKKGDILLEKSGGSPTQPVGRVVYFDRDTPHLYSNFTQKLAPAKNCDSKYLFYKLYFEYQNGTVLKFQQQTTGIINFQLAEYLGFQTVFAPLPEQQKIAAILSSVDDVIEKTRAQIDKLKDLKTGMMQELLTKGIGSGGVPHTEFKDSPVGRIPTTWNVLPLEQLVRSDRNITYGIVQAGPHHEEGVPYIRVSDMTRRHLSLDGMLRTSPEIAQKYKRSSVSAGDIVYALRGVIGHVHLVPAELDGANLTQGTARLSPNDSVHSRYMLWAMKSPAVQLQNDLEAKGSTFKEVTLASLRKIQITLPPAEEQVKITSVLDSIERKLHGSEDKFEHLQRLKKALMQDLLTGKVRVKVDQKESAVA